MTALITEKILAATRTNNQNDNIYVENAAHSFLCAEQGLINNPSKVGGEPFFITNGAGIKYQEFLQLAAKYFGGKIVHVAEVLSILAPTVEWLTSISRGSFPMPGTLKYLSPSVLLLSRLDATFSDAKAQRLLDYHPVYSMEEGMQLTVQYWQQLKKSNQRGNTGPNQKKQL